MNQSDQKKLCDAGYMIIRRDDQPKPRIKYKMKGVGDWKTLETFESKAARDRRANELNTLKAYIED